MRQVLGHNLLGQMMERLSVHCDAGLSKRYMNHCVRATCVGLLKERGVEDRTVCAITSHKNERSLSTYEKLNKQKRKKLPSYLDGESSGSAKLQTLRSPIGSHKLSEGQVFKRKPFFLGPYCSGCHQRTRVRVQQPHA